MRVLCRIKPRAEPLLTQIRQDAAPLCQRPLRGACRMVQALHHFGEEKLEQQRELVKR